MAPRKNDEPTNPVTWIFGSNKLWDAYAAAHRRRFPELHPKPYYSQHAPRHKGPGYFFRTEIVAEVDGMASRGELG